MSLFTSYTPASIALQSLYEQFPSAKRFYLFYKASSVSALEVENDKSDVFISNELISKALITHVQKFRADKTEIIWCDKEDLPIKRKKKDFKQISIDDEIEQNVLVFRVPSAKDELNDVFAIEFPKSLSNFYLHSGRNAMSSQLKKSIGHVIREQVLWLYRFYSVQKESVYSIQHAYQNYSDDYQKVLSDLKEEKEKTISYFNQYLSNIIANKESDLDCSISCSGPFSEEIRNRNISIDRLQYYIEKAIQTAYDLSINKTHINLTPNLIPNSKDQSVSSGSDKTIRLIQLDKTMSLLDRYEESARILEREGKNINGKNLAVELKISGPAITDAIKKHSSKIAQLFEKHSNKWPLIRKSIKPVREIHWTTLSKNA